MIYAAIHATKHGQGKNRTSIKLQEFHSTHMIGGFQSDYVCEKRGKFSSEEPN